MRVLVVDDDVVHRTMAVDCLVADGIEVESGHCAIATHVVAVGPGSFSNQAVRTEHAELTADRG